MECGLRREWDEKEKKNYENGWDEMALGCDGGKLWKWKFQEEENKNFRRGENWKIIFLKIKLKIKEIKNCPL